MANISILIVDDAAYMRRILRLTLLDIGYDQVSEADSGLTALKLFEKSSFDLIICDINMPGMSGLELLREIRSGKTRAPSNSRVIFMTALTNSDVLRDSMRLEVNGYMLKPIKAETVKKNILRVLKENLLLKNEEFYQTIDLCMQGGNQIRTRKPYAADDIPRRPEANEEGVPLVEPGSQSADCQAQLSENGVATSVFQLEIGSILAEDLRTTDGKLLLSAGQRLTTRHIHRIHDLGPMLETKLIKVLKPEDQGDLEC